MNDYERECTARYEGTYTAEEIALNKQLYDACMKENIDFDEVEALLRLGADPLGGVAETGWDLLVHIYGEIICEGQDLPHLTDLFLKYGMDVDHPRIPYDDENSTNPLWNFAFATDENGARALKMLLENGLSASSFGHFVDHILFDMLDVCDYDPNKDEFWRDACEWTLKMLLLGASYDHILQNDEDLGQFLGCQYNDFDVHAFRNWDDFCYEFDTSRCETPGLCRSVATIRDVRSGAAVWRVGICLEEGEF